MSDRCHTISVITVIPIGDDTAAECALPAITAAAGTIGRQNSEVRGRDTLISGLGLLESPRWHDGRLWVADWTAGLIRAIDPAGGVQIVVGHQSLPLCFDFLPDLPANEGLVLTSSSERALLRLSGHGTLSR